MKPKIAVTKKLPKKIESQIRKKFNVLFMDDINESSYKHFLSILSSVEGILVTSAFKFNDEILDYAQNLKVISTIAVGYDNLPIKKLTKHNIIVTNTPDVLTETTADTIFGLLMTVARRFSELDQYVKEGYWTNIIEEELFGTDVHNKTIGIIGLGKVGGAVAKRANLGFNMKVLYYNRSQNTDAEQRYGAQYTSMDYLLKNSDFVCLTVPLTSKTTGLMNLNQLKKMKKTAFLINGSRGKVLEEEDLIYALKNRIIKGAGLDVYESEPINPEHPILNFPNVVTLPHIGSATNETRYKMANVAIDNLLKVLDGQPTNYIVKDSN